MMGPISNLPEHPFQLIFDIICIKIIELSCVIEKKTPTAKLAGQNFVIM
jgi:hypothetical protein